MSVFCFSSRLTSGHLKNHRTPQQLCCLRPNMLVQYQSSSIIAMIVSRESQEITGSYYGLKGHPASSQRGIILNESTLIRQFSRRSGRRGCSSGAVVQRRSRVSKLRLKGLSDYHSNERVVKASRREASGPNKGYSHGISTQTRELDNSSKPNWTRAKDSPPGKNTMDKKSYSLLLRVTMQMGQVEVDEDDDEREPVEPITSPCDSVLGYWDQKASVNRGHSAHTLGAGGLGSYLTPVTWYRNRWSMQHLWWVITPTWRIARNFIFYRELQYVMFYNIILGLGKTTDNQDRFLVIHLGGVNFYGRIRGGE
jgi:hypothetical protein